MAYSTRNNISEQQHNNANPQTATAQFADNRTSAATQLKQQTLMAASPTATAQRAAVNTMNASAVQQQKIIQRAAPEEELQMKSIQSTAQLAGMGEEELLQGKFETTQRVEDEELLQGKFETTQRVEDEELLQGKFDTAQRAEDEELLQGKFEPAQRAEKPNNTGLPDNLKSGIENLSGISMDHVKVHYNSEKPAQLQAHAYAQGSDIHVAPGQEQHLPHEAWHVVQQAQGRVRPTVQMKGNVPVNDDIGLESEADVMGAKALQRVEESQKTRPDHIVPAPVTQREAITQTEDQIFDKNGAHKSKGSTNPFNLVGTLNGPNYSTIIVDNSGTRFHNAHMMAATFGGDNTATNIVAWNGDMENEWTNAENDIRGTNEDKLVAPRKNEEGEVKTTVEVPDEHESYGEIIDSLMELARTHLIDPANWTRVDPNAAQISEGTLRGHYDDGVMMERLKIRMGVDVRAAFGRMPTSAFLSYQSAEPDNKRQYKWRFNAADEIVQPRNLVNVNAVLALIRPLVIEGFRLT